MGVRFKVRRLEVEGCGFEVEGWRLRVEGWRFGVEGWRLWVEGCWFEVVGLRHPAPQMAEELQPDTLNAEPLS